MQVDVNDFYISLGIALDKSEISVEVRKYFEKISKKIDVFRHQSFLKLKITMEDITSAMLTKS